MGIILGFGCIEERVRADVKNALISALLKGESINDILKPYNDKADEYDKMPRETAPERYTRIYFYDNTLTFMHINRRHGFSPDGWAMWEVKESFGEQVEKEIEI